MNLRPLHLRFRRILFPAAACAAFLYSPEALHADVTSNLQSLPRRIPVGDPLVAAVDIKEGPKGMAAADFNQDGKQDLAVGNLDGTITVLLSLGGGNFQTPRHIRTGALELRAVLAADLNGDGRPDLAAASPMDGKLLIHFNAGGGNFGTAVPLAGWIGVRALAAGDFNGDNVMDLAAAGPGLGVRHFRGTGVGAFEIMGDLPRLSPLYSEIPRPVYTLRTLRSRDGLRDDLLVTHADSPALWILSTAPVNRSNEPVVVNRVPAWQPSDPPVIINELQALNATTLRDADNTAQPWVELLNVSPQAQNLAGWKLKFQSAEWTIPAVPAAIVQPGRFLVVFLSGKDRNTGPELHASLVLKQNTVSLTLLQPGETEENEANTIDLPDHSLVDISYGRAPDEAKTRWFDIPSPGAENNAGLSLADIPGESVTTLTITPRNPTPGQPVTVRVVTPARPTGTSSVRTVWFSFVKGVQEVHRLTSPVSAGVYEVVLPPGEFTGSTPHRVLARLRDGSNNDFTVELHPGLDGAAAGGASTPLPGRLLPVASVPSPKVKAFAVGPVRVPTWQAGAQPDLVYAEDESGLLRVHRAAPDARRFEPVAIQDSQVRGAPRDVELADTDGDGWLDATVVMRNLDLAVTFKNEAGILRATGELSTGKSPRELVMADFTDDGRTDAAVANRYSADVSILPGSAVLTGLVSIDQVYPVDGEVAGLFVSDANGDGRADVTQLHRASGEMSTRFASENGMLGPPVFRSLGAYGTSDLIVTDVNNDGVADTLSANLGSESSGSVSVLLAKASGGFEEPSTIRASGALFAIASADFNKDGHADLVTGLFDCRVEFFNGDGTGNFEAAYEFPLPFANEARRMVTGDFDQDGDIDIAGAGYAGDLVTLENRGAATPQSWFRRLYPLPGPDKYGSERIATANLNGDGDPDLIIGTGNGVLVYTGALGMSFVLETQYTSASGISYAVSDVLAVDLENDGVLDMVSACRSAACINIVTQGTDGRFVPHTQAAVPSARYLAAGDVDGDGKPDLVGTGDSLWTVLSSRPAQPASPGTTATDRPRTTGVVINEVLGRNTGVPVSADNGRKSDFIEIFNGASVPAILTGWKVRVVSSQEGEPLDRTWTLPETVAAPLGRTVLVFSEDPGPMNAGFTLPAEGGTITLLRPDDSEADLATYPHAQENVSWSRYQDGHSAFRADPIPSPGLNNLDNGPPPPEVRLTPPSPATLIPDASFAFTANGRDDLGIVSLSLIWNRLASPYATPQRTVLYDNGESGDGLPLDGFFRGLLAPGQPPGTEVQFYLEAVDLSGKTLILPEGAALVAPGQPLAAWSFSLTTPPALEISEASAGNVSLRRDELGGYPDYITVRNKGTGPVNMSNILLAKSPLSDRSEVFAFPSGLVLPAGGETTVFADNNINDGPLHAPFTLDAGGEDVSLLAVRPSGARQWIHSITVPPGTEDSRYLRLPGTNLHATLTSAADLTNWSGISYEGNGAARATVHFLALAGFNYNIEGDAAGQPVAWTLLETISGDGAVKTVTRPLSEMTALRVINTSLPVLRVDSAAGGIASAWIYGSATGATGVTLFYGQSDGGTAPAAWEFSLESTGPDFSFHPENLTAAKAIHYRLRARNAGGDTWSPPGTSLQTRKPTASVAKELTLAALHPDSARISVTGNPLSSYITGVTILLGTADARDIVAAWQRSAPATLGSWTWDASFSGLSRETEYFARAVFTSANGQIVSAQRLQFRTPNPRENIALNLRLSEIMYKPVRPGDYSIFYNDPVNGLAQMAAEVAAGYEDDDFEFLELQNTSTESMDLSGLWFEGVDYDFPASGGPVLPPGGFAVIASHPHAFALRYGAGIPLAGFMLHPFRRSKLSNNSEDIVLRAADGTLIFSVYYPDRGETDGRGESLEYDLPANELRAEVETDYYNGGKFGGTPGGLAVNANLYGPPAPVGFYAWRLLHFGLAQMNDATFGANADPDLDGRSNFDEYAFGSNPLISDVEDGLFTRPLGIAEYLVLSIRGNASAVDAVFGLESSADLATWAGEYTYAYDQWDRWYAVGSNQFRIDSYVPFVETPPETAPPRKFFRLRTSMK